MKLVAFAVLIMVLTPGGALAQGDAVAGAALFKKCTACHSVGEGAANKIGPVLNDVVGRAAAVFPGFAYSDALTDAGATGLMWTPETLDQWLTKPADFLPGTMMAFVGITDDDDRANVIAYLLTLSPDYAAPVIRRPTPPSQSQQ